MKLKVLIVEHDQDQFRTIEALVTSTKVHVDVRFPEDVRVSDLRRAHLVLVDFKIEEWNQGRDGMPGALAPQDGLALTSIYQSYLARKEGRSRPTAFAIITYYIDDLAGRVPIFNEHILARLVNLDWVLQKQNIAERIPVNIQVASLAEATKKLRLLRTNSEPSKIWPKVKKLLAIPPISKCKWAPLVEEDIRRSQPPIHELLGSSHESSFLKWLLHRILPYPCFLLDIHQLAKRFGVTKQSLEKEVGRNRKLTRFLDQFRYHGILSDFLGDRWWRAGIDWFVWNEAKDALSNSNSLRTVLKKHGGNHLEFVALHSPVVCLDGQLRFQDDFEEIESAVRILPDDWPPYADAAWVPISLAQQDEMVLSMVLEEDRDKI